MENEIGCKIQTLRSDNGKEYTSHQFNSFCEKARIEHQLTVPYTLEQNGVCGRRKKMLWRWLDVCYMKRICQRCFGQRLQIQLCSYKIDFLQSH